MQPDLVSERDRLHQFWNSRYSTFALSESGWLGAGERLNGFLYDCKLAAIRHALARIGRRRTAHWSVLDAGCGQGYFARFYAREYANATYVGVDISDRAVDHLRETLPAMEFHAADLSQWNDPRGRTFDVVQCIDVLPLLLDDEEASQVVTRLKNLVAPGGTLLVTELLPDATVEPNTYMRYRSRAFWAGEFARLGLTIERAQAIYYWLPTGGPTNRYLRFALTRLGPRAVYWTDRLAHALRLPWPASAGLDCRVQLLTLRPKS
jgi:2-polyprenyl-3-methyl-5-hydroxy-6-metoxy-1,4-benzoquinol methylase